MGQGSEHRADGRQWPLKDMCGVTAQKLSKRCKKAQSANSPLRYGDASLTHWSKHASKSRHLSDYVRTPRRCQLELGAKTWWRQA
jgi:hypothetical protein